MRIAYKSCKSRCAKRNLSSKPSFLLRKINVSTLRALTSKEILCTLPIFFMILIWQNPCISFLLILADHLSDLQTFCIHYLSITYFCYQLLIFHNYSILFLSSTFQTHDDIKLFSPQRFSSHNFFLKGRHG